MTRVLVVADPPESAAALASLLADHDPLVVVGAVSGVARFMENGIDAPDVDVVLLEPDPEPGAGPALPAGEEEHPGRAARLLILDDPAPDRVGEALRAGIRGVVTRSAGRSEIVAAIEAVAAGLMVLPPELAEPLLGPRWSEPTPPASGTLTPREVEVLRLLAEGRGNKGIAVRLGISAYTVKTHVTSILAKLRVGTRAEAVAEGVRRGLILL